MSLNFLVDDNEIQNNIPEVVNYKKQLEDLSRSWHMLNLLNQVSEGGANMESSQLEFSTLTTSLILNLTLESLKQLSNEVNSKSQVVVDIVIRNLFERTADIGFLATDDSIRDFILDFKELKNREISFRTYNEDNNTCKVCPTPFVNECKSGNESIHMNFMKELLCKGNNPDEKSKTISNIEELKESLRLRFKEYTQKYSVYYDVILSDTQGNILVNLDKNNKINKTKDSLIQETLKTSADYYEKLGKSDLRVDKDEILTYSFRVTTTNDKNSEVIGVLILCFDFEDEMKKVFKSLDAGVKGLNLMLLDRNNRVISSSNELQMPKGTRLKPIFTEHFNIVSHGGRKYITKTSKTKGYEGFFGLEWSGHIMIDIAEAFSKMADNLSTNIEENILNNVLNSKSLFSNDLQAIPLSAKRIQDDLNRAVWNGNLQQQTNIAKKLLNQLSITGEKTKTVFNNSINSLHETVLKTLLSSVSFQSFLAVDIMDRNLYERANDCRWWAITPKFREILEKNNLTADDSKELISILKYINNLYTVYTNLIIFDKNKKIVAVSNDNYKSLINTTINHTWVEEILNINNSQKYVVSKFEKSEFYADDYTYIYGACIKSLNNEAISNGGIAIVFDSRPQFKAILEDIVPDCSNSFAIFANSRKMILSSTNDNFKVGDNLLIDDRFFNLKPSDSFSTVIELNEKFYAVGSRYSSGYREFKTLDGYKNNVISLVFSYLCDKEEMSLANLINNESTLTFDKDGSRIEEIGTFYIGGFWYGLLTHNLEAAISLDDLHRDKRGDVLLAGRVSYNDKLVEVVNLHKYLDVKATSEKQEIVIMKLTGTNNGFDYLGLLVDELGPILDIPETNIQNTGTLYFKTADFVSRISKPPKDSKKILFLIEPKELLKKLLEVK